MPIRKDRFTEQRRKEREEAQDNRNEAYIEEIKLRRNEDGILHRNTTQ